MWQQAESKLLNEQCFPNIKQ